MIEPKFEGNKTNSHSFSNNDKIIFLDIDGVLNGYGLLIHWLMKFCSRFNLVSWFHKYSGDLYSIHKRKFKRLVKIVRKTDAKIILSSSWRYAYIHHPDTPDIQLLNKLLDTYHITIFGTLRTNCRFESRANLIKEWLSNNEVDNFVIIDDEVSDIIQQFPNNTVSTSDRLCRNPHYLGCGLKRNHVKQAINILSRK